MIFIIVLSIVFFDQLFKFLVSRNLSFNQSLPIIKNVFHLTLVHNQGAAFGIFKSQVNLFILISICAIIVIVLSLKKYRGKKLNLYSFSLVLILAGASGNLIDRIAFGYVIDFLDFRIWPVFNIADSAITIGAVLLSWSVLYASNSL